MFGIQNKVLEFEYSRRTALLWLSVEYPSHSPCVRTLGPQLVALFWEVGNLLDMIPLWKMLGCKDQARALEQVPTQPGLSVLKMGSVQACAAPVVRCFYHHDGKYIVKQRAKATIPSLGPHLVRPCILNQIFCLTCCFFQSIERSFLFSVM